MKVLVFPHDRANPYQDLLYEALRPEGVDAHFLAAPTGSQTLNVLLLPALLVAYRLQGFRLLHLHWAYPFAPPWTRDVPAGRRLMQAWFSVFLATARLVGFRVVWTAHNLLPHAPVFADDAAARRRLIRAADAVIAHSATVVPGLEELGAKRVEVVPHGAYAARYRQDLDRGSARRRLGLAGEGRVVAFVGVVHPYKGVDVLLEAAAELPDDVPLRILVAGRCPDDDVRRQLTALAGVVAERVTTRFEHIPDDELQAYFAACDAVVLPFRRITTSGSLLLALTFGVPVVIPDLPELVDVPDDVAFRFTPGPTPLARTLARVASEDDAVLGAMAARARAYAASMTWERSASATAALYRRVLSGRYAPASWR